jgi:hypothetical protein
LTIFRIFYRNECINQLDKPSGSMLQPTAVCFFVAAALTLAANAVFLFKPRPNRLWTVLGFMCSKWQPSYFILVSAQKIVFWAIAIIYADMTIDEPSGECPLSPLGKRLIYVAVFLWNCTILAMGASIFCGDLDPDFTPAIRRRAHGVLSLCLIVDAVGSYIWGNAMASQISAVSVISVNFLVDTQISSCITSQVVIALHFLFVSCRARDGHAWAYESLRFELDDNGKALLPGLDMPQIKQDANEIPMTNSASTLLSQLETVPDSLPVHAAASATAFSRLRQRWLLFQRRHVANCRVFVIPCVIIRDEMGALSRPHFALVRPLFHRDASLLRPLRQLASAHPKMYFVFSFSFVMVPNIACAIFCARTFDKGVATLILNVALLILFLGFCSSIHGNLDTVAVKHVASSFRFAICVALLAQGVALDSRLAFNGEISFLQPMAVAVMAMLFCSCALLECSPTLPVTAQIVITVFFFAC